MALRLPWPIPPYRMSYGCAFLGCISAKSNQLLQFELKNKESRKISSTNSDLSFTEEECHYLAFSPKVLRQRLFIDLSTRHQRHVDLLPQEVENQLPQGHLYLLDGEGSGLGFQECLLELGGGLEGEESFEVVPVDVFLVELFDFGHNLVVIFGLVRVV